MMAPRVFPGSGVPTRTRPPSLHSRDSLLRPMTEPHGRLFVDHRVGVFDPLAVGPGVLEDDLHHRVIGPAARPVALEFEEHLLPGDRDGTGLDDSLHRAAVGRLAG